MHDKQKYDVVIKKNTFYFFDVDFEREYESQNIDAISTLLSNLYAEIESKGVRREYFEAPQWIKSNIGIEWFI